jgi:DNA polymerase III delta prime subunit
MIKLNDQQKELVKQLQQYLNRKDKTFFGVYGAGGTGKTTAILESIKEDPKDIMFLGATNKVVNILKSGFRKKGQEEYTIKTIDSFLSFKMEKDHNNKTVTKRKLPKKADIPKIIIIDECSMINEESVNFLIKLKGKCRVILIGDEMQIPPVLAGEDASKIVRNKEGFKVSTIFNHIENHYTLTIQNRQKEGSDLFDLISGFRQNMHKRIEDILYYEDYNSKEFKKHLYGESFISVAYKNLTCLTFNWLIGSTKANDRGYKVSEINEGDTVFFDTYYKSEDTRFYTSEVIKVLERYNNEERTFGIDGDVVTYHVDVLRVENEVGAIFDIDISRGQKETISKIYYRLQRARKRLKREAEESNNLKYKWVLRKKIAKINTLYSDFRLGLAKLKKPYAITSHKSQGSTYNDVIIPVYDFYSREPQDANQLMYVAMSRAAKRIIFVNKKSNFKNNSNRYHFTELERAAIASNQEWKCKGVMLGDEYEGGRKEIGCGVEFQEGRDFEVDHIKRLEEGGSNNPTNLQTLCKNCHKEKTLTEKN